MTISRSQLRALSRLTPLAGASAEELEAISASLVQLDPGQSCSTAVKTWVVAGRGEAAVRGAPLRILRQGDFISPDSFPMSTIVTAVTAMQLLQLPDDPSRVAATANPSCSDERGHDAS